MPAQSTMIPQQQLIEAARAPLLGFNEKDWKAVRAAITPGFVYDEVATGRTARGADDVIALWQGWASAFPDARASFHRELSSGDSVVFEVTWRGTHQGPLQTPEGAVPPTGKRIEVRACFVVDMQDDKPARERHYFDMGTLLQQIGVGS
jgi:steroid delta-isomerase-like uncharacterized protein